MVYEKLSNYGNSIKRTILSTLAACALMYGANTAQSGDARLKPNYNDSKANTELNNSSYSIEDIVSPINKYSSYLHPTTSSQSLPSSTSNTSVKNLDVKPVEIKPYVDVKPSVNPATYPAKPINVDTDKVGATTDKIATTDKTDTYQTASSKDVKLNDAQINSNTNNSSSYDPQLKDSNWRISALYDGDPRAILDYKILGDDLSLRGRASASPHSSASLNGVYNGENFGSHLGGGVISAGSMAPFVNAGLYFRFVNDYDISASGVFVSSSDKESDKVPMNTYVLCGGKNFLEDRLRLALGVGGASGSGAESKAGPYAMVNYQGKGRKYAVVFGFNGANAVIGISYGAPSNLGPWSERMFEPSFGDRINDSNDGNLNNLTPNVPGIPKPTPVYTPTTVTPDEHEETPTGGRDQRPGGDDIGTIPAPVVPTGGRDPLVGGDDAATSTR